MGRFAKIIEMPFGQVLITRDWDSEEEAEKVTVHLDFNGARLQVGIGFNSTEAADECFEDYSIPHAQAIYDNVAKGLGF